MLEWRLAEQGAAAEWKKDGENMPQPLDPNDLVTVEDLAISSMWDIAALVEELERRGLLPKGKNQTAPMFWAIWAFSLRRNED